MGWRVVCKRRKIGTSVIGRGSMSVSVTSLKKTELCEEFAVAREESRCMSSTLRIIN